METASGWPWPVSIHSPGQWRNNCDLLRFVGMCQLQKKWPMVIHLIFSWLSLNWRIFYVKTVERACQSIYISLLTVVTSRWYYSYSYKLLLFYKFITQSLTKWRPDDSQITPGADCVSLKHKASNRLISRYGGRYYIGVSQSYQTYSLSRSGWLCIVLSPYSVK